MLQAALAAGLASEGADVIDVGVLPTPALAWLSVRRDLPAVVISASHNPFPDNGIKLFGSGGTKLSEVVERAIEDELHRVLDPSVKGPRPLEGHGVGTVRAESGVGDAYVGHLLGALDGRTLDGLRIVVDSANGSASGLAARLFEGAGADVLAIGCEPDGTNINAGCGSTATERCVRRGGGARRPRGSGARRRRRPPAGRGRDRCAGRRGRTAGAVRPGPGRPRPAGGQHGGRDGHDQPRLPPGHGRSRDPRQGDRRRRPARAGRHRPGGLLARGGAVRPHHLPAPGHDGRRPADRPHARRPAGPVPAAP